jgi:hypothetical protein
MAAVSDTGINWDVVHEYVRPALSRMAHNLRETGHPYHHLTRSGVIVDSDPRAHVMHDEHLWEAGIAFYVPMAWRHPRKSKPRVEDWYSTRTGRIWLKKQSTGGIVEAAPLPAQSTLW